MLAAAIIATAFALLLGVQNLALSRRLEWWRTSYMLMRQDYLELWSAKSSAQFKSMVEESDRLVGKARGKQ